MLNLLLKRNTNPKAQRSLLTKHSAITTPKTHQSNPRALFSQRRIVASSIIVDSSSKNNTPSLTPVLAYALSLRAIISTLITLSRSKHSALAFNRKDVTEFLEDFNRQTNNSSLSNQQKVIVLLDYLDNPNRFLMRILKRLLGYGTKNQPALQDSMQEQQKDQNTTLLLSKRSYLQTYITKCIYYQLGLTEYYMQFSALANAYIAARQIPKEEKGILFFKGLSKKNKEAIMFLYAVASKANIQNFYNYDAIY